MEDYLECKLGLYLEKYYFILHEKVLTYCTKQNGPKVGQIHLQISKFQIRDLTLHIDTGMDKIILIFKNNQQRDQWYDAMMQTVDSIENEILKVKQLQSQFDELLKQFVKTIEPNPTFQEASEKLDQCGNKILDDISTIAELFTNKSSEFQSCESLNDDYAQTLKSPPIYDIVEAPQININIWGHLKQKIQMSLRDMRIPIYLQSPQTMLQRISEQMIYADLLNTANQYKDQELRACYCLGFYLSQYSKIQLQLPILSHLHETYEIIDSFKYISEQVADDNIAFFSNSQFFELSGAIKLGNYFRDLQLNITIDKKLNILLRRGRDLFQIESKDHYIQIRNLITQKPEVQVFGTINIQNSQVKGQVQFDKGVIQGQVGKYIIKGNCEKITATNSYNEQFVIFKQKEGFKYDKHSQLLPPSDSRFRKDLIAMRQGKYLILKNHFYILKGNFQIAQQYQNEKIIFPNSWFQMSTDYQYKGGYFSLARQYN